MNKLQKIFHNNYPIIGVVHLMPSPGFKGFESISLTLNRALEDAKSLENGGVDGIIIENNYDLPHKIYVNPETITTMTYVALKIKKKVKLPIGISVLWNDYKAALSIAKISEAKFVRIPAFVDNVKTNYGNVMPVAKRSIIYRKTIDSENIAIFADIQVKHAIMLDKNKSLVQSAFAAKKQLADAIIVTGKWTGDAPTINNLRLLKKKAIDIPIIVGSGANKANVQKLMKYSDGIIVSTTFKFGNNKKSEINVKDYEQRISQQKVTDFINKIKKN